MRSSLAKVWSVLLVVLLLGITACSGKDASLERGLAGEEQGVEGPTPAPAVINTDDAVDEDSQAEGGDPEAPSGDIKNVAYTSPNFGRDIIFVADMTVATSDVATATQQARVAVEELGGFLYGQASTGGPNPQSVLTFKVDPDRFQDALAALASIGEVRTQNVSANDVTERVVDLESQIETAAASVDRLRDLLDQATDIKEIVSLENELLVRETQLETLRGQLRSLQEQVALATITATLTEADANPAIALTVTGYPGLDEAVGCPGDEQFIVEEGSEATVCFEILNSGDTLLEDFDLQDPVLDIETDDLIVVFGDPSMRIEPGESLVLAAEVSIERTLQTRTTVTAQPVSEDGELLGDRSATQTSSVYLEAVDPGGIPTFTQGLTASWEWLVSLGQVLLLIGGALLPFVWIPLVIWLIWRLRRDRVRPAVSSADSSD